MKPNLLMLFLIFAIACSNNTSKKYNAEKDLILKHKIKSIAEYRTEFELGKANAESLATVKYYNEKGELIAEKGFLPNGDLSISISHEYDAFGNLIRTTALNKDNKLEYKVEFTYDEKHNRLDKVFTLSDGSLKYKNHSTYNSNGELSELKWYRTEGWVSTNNYSYQDGLVYEDVELNPKGEINYKWVYKYNNNGMQTEARQFYSGGILNSKIISEYNESNLLSKQMNYFGENLMDIAQYLYNEKGLKTLIKNSSPSNRPLSETRIEYEYY